MRALGTTESAYCDVEGRVSCLNFNKVRGARDRNRTGTSLSRPGILSPVRLPVSPPGRCVSTFFGLKGIVINLRLGSMSAATPVLIVLYWVTCAITLRIISTKRKLAELLDVRFDRVVCFFQVKSRTTLDQHSFTSADETATIAFPKVQLIALRLNHKLEAQRRYLVA